MWNLKKKIKRPTHSNTEFNGGYQRLGWGRGEGNELLIKEYKLPVIMS